MPRASALASPTVKTASRPARTRAAARAQRSRISATEAAISTPTTIAAVAETRVAGTIR
jgi:hypothetical protein